MAIRHEAIGELVWAIHTSFRPTPAIAISDMVTPSRPRVFMLTGIGFITGYDNLIRDSLSAIHFHTVPSGY